MVTKMIPQSMEKGIICIMNPEILAMNPKVLVLNPEIPAPNPEKRAVYPRVYNLRQYGACIRAHVSVIGWQTKKPCSR
jgi:hypothetical protein